jgi:BirA family transcriptional regulator, biotin operon repressor / biotin---[acetyl-CoA-carboxylase] ligase
LYKISDGIEFAGKSVYFLSKCHSTNDIAAELLGKALLAPGSVVITSHQTAGKGQRGNRWESEPGKNLTFSIVLSPDFLLADKNFSLNIVTSLALTDALRQFREGFSIKWPNDIYYKEGKIGGILIENSIISGKIATSIIGIGLNVNQLNFSGSYKATSLAHICSETFDLNELLNLILQCFDKRWKTLLLGGFDALEADYLSRLYGLGIEKRFGIDGDKTCGIIEGIDPAGKLIVSIKNIPHTFSFQEIKFLN